ncbi:MAG: aspartate aminotransferase family protein, partial [Lachnospiraceae bacterium]|nr:aspartate aminotransferase family protein [Lachnospiraceae bacterium]
ETLGERLFEGIERMLLELGLPFRVNHVGSLGSLFFTAEPVRDYTSAKTADTGLFKAYFRHMLEAGIYLAPSQFEAIFLSAAHTDENIDFTLNVMQDFLKKA